MEFLPLIPTRFFSIPEAPGSDASRKKGSPLKSIFRSFCKCLQRIKNTLMADMGREYIQAEASGRMCNQGITEHCILCRTSFSLSSGTAAIITSEESAKSGSSDQEASQKRREPDCFFQFLIQSSEFYSRR